MAFKITFGHLAVGQGLAAFTDLSYGDQGRFLALMDLGSSAGGKDFYQDSLNQIINAVYKNNHTLNYVHISHLDADHYNLFPHLGAQYLERYGKRITIARFGIGGAGLMDPQQIQNFIAENFGCFQLPDFYYTDNGQGFYRTGNPYTPFVMDQFVKDWDVSIEIEPMIDFRINILFYRACFFDDVFDRLSNNHGAFINTGSTMILISIVRVLNPQNRSHVKPIVSYLFTGDATIDTLKCFLDVGQFQFQDEPKALLIPHHGTKLHIADNPDTNNADTFITLNRFLRNFPPAWAAVSAKCTQRSGWVHPHVDVMNLVNSVLPHGDEARVVTAFEITDELVVRQITTYHLWATFVLDGVADNTPFSDDDKEHFHLYDCNSYYDTSQVSIEELNHGHT